ncbi:MAG: helix-turn-helix domain-containing protein [Candidatus Latescibacteria bacterium]|nr:helix-turn-helix domain-containing protein [Candidatus Latescibacterota bacterium]
MIPKLLTPSEVAQALGVTTSTLAIWRCNKRYDLPYTKIGRLVMYRQVDVEAFIETRLHNAPTP